MTTTYRELGNHTVPPAAVTNTLDVDASGDLDMDIGPFTGILDTLFIDIGTLEATTDITITNKTTGEQIYAKSNISADTVARPRLTPQGNDGADLSALTILEPLYMVNDELNVVVDEGGVSKSGALTLLIR